MKVRGTKLKSMRLTTSSSPPNSSCWLNYKFQLNVSHSPTALKHSSFLLTYLGTYAQFLFKELTSYMQPALSFFHLLVGCKPQCVSVWVSPTEWVWRTFHHSDVSSDSYTSLLKAGVTSHVCKDFSI